MENNALNLAMQQALRASGKNPAWQAQQLQAAQAANLAGLPFFSGSTQEAPARLRLKDAIARSESAGFKVQHFIGTPNEPTGDRGVTMDIENLVNSLKAQEKQALQNKDTAQALKISLEKDFWQKEADAGMSAKQWNSQTGENDPVYLPAFRVNPQLRDISL